MAVNATSRVLALEELIAWGIAFGAEVMPPAVVGISGDVGAGKTTLVQAICRGFGVRDQVTSPTFALVHEYRATRGTVYHLDLYRLADPGQLTNIGWDDIVNSDALVLVEWPEHAGERLPHDAIMIHLEHVSGAADRRRLRVSG
ncbi:MAG TPA: tRNA (adenosine(37)-N6)-threonylcarbamoyltransferase complex ATPase subunit type 1 TsaE [Gemmatimonadaceae bacterium]